MGKPKMYRLKDGTTLLIDFRTANTLAHIFNLGPSEAWGNHLSCTLDQICELSPADVMEPDNSGKIVLKTIRFALQEHKRHLKNDEGAVEDDYLYAQKLWRRKKAYRKAWNLS